MSTGTSTMRAWQLPAGCTSVERLELVELPKGAVVARARMTGKCSGDAPAITAQTATFSTVSCRDPPVIFTVVTTSLGLRLVPLSISITRFSVGIWTQL